MSTEPEDANVTDTDTDTDGNEADGEAQNESVYRREPARRVFAAELAASTHLFRESDEDRAPKYALLPTGERMNRCFFVGTLLNISHVGNDGGMVKARLVDNSGSPGEEGGGRIYAYAGQYAPDAAAALERIDPPEYVAIVAKPNTFETDDGETVFSLRPESVTVVDADQRNNWVLDTARATLDRIERFEAGEGEYAERASDTYGTDMTPYRGAVRRSLESLTDD